jgi:hypothetical protein
MPTPQKKADPAKTADVWFNNDCFGRCGFGCDGARRDIGEGNPRCGDCAVR